MMGRHSNFLKAFMRIIKFLTALSICLGLAIFLGQKVANAQEGAGEVNYIVQIAAGTNYEIAFAEADALIPLGITAYVDTFQRDGRNIYRTRIGPFTSQDEAQRLVNKLNEAQRQVNKLTTIRTAQAQDPIVITSPKNAPQPRIVTRADVEGERLAALDKIRQNEIDEVNKQYGSTGVGLIISKVAKECLVSEGWACRVTGINLVITAGVRNNLNRDVKDVKIKCRHFAQSGTELSTLLNTSSTILQKWSPGETRNISFPIGDVSQRYKTTCSITGWS
jgi:hypothetical protein